MTMAVELTRAGTIGIAHCHRCVHFEYADHAAGVWAERPLRVATI